MTEEQLTEQPEASLLPDDLQDVGAEEEADDIDVSATLSKEEMWARANRIARGEDDASAEAKKTTDEPPLPPVKKPIKEKQPQHDWKKRYDDSLRFIETLKQEKAQVQTELASVQSMRVENLELKEQLRALQAQVSELSARRTNQHEPEAGDHDELEEYAETFPEFYEMANKLVERRLGAAKVPEEFESVRQTVEEIKAERRRQAEIQALSARHQAANKALGITNASEIDGSAEFGRWVDQDAWRTQTAMQFDNRTGFVALIRDFLAEHPAVAKAIADSAPPERPARRTPASPAVHSRTAKNPANRKPIQTEEDKQRFWQELMASNRQSAQNKAV